MEFLSACDCKDYNLWGVRLTTVQSQYTTFPVIFQKYIKREREGTK